MNSQPKLVAFDLDSTLAESKQSVSTHMGELLGKLMQKMPVAVLSGAAFHQFQDQLLPALPVDALLEHLYLFPTSAASCYVWKDSAWQAQYEHTFTPEEKAHIMEALREALEETGLAQLQEKVWGEQIEDRGGQITFSALGQEAPVEAKRVWDPDKSKRLPLRAALLKRLPEYAIGVNATTSIDINRKGISKAYGIRELSKITGIPVAQMLYVGDALMEGGNDAVVTETGIPIRQVSGPEETATVIEEILGSFA